MSTVETKRIVYIAETQVRDSVLDWGIKRERVYGELTRFDDVLDME